MGDRDRKDESFKVIDKRMFGTDGEVRQQAKSQIDSRPEQQAENSTQTGEIWTKAERIPKASFSELILYLASMANMFLEDEKNTSKVNTNPDLPAARHYIDLFSIFAEKTKGNCTHEEEKLIAGLLTELQIRFIEKSKANVNKK